MANIILLCRDQSLQEDFRAAPRQIGDKMRDLDFPAFWPPRHIRLLPHRRASAAANRL